MDKAAVRQLVMAARAEAHRTSVADAAARLCDIALPLLLDRSKAGLIFAGYWPIQTEIDPRPLMRELSNKSRLMALPAVVGPSEPLTFRAWAPGAATISGVFGTLVPLPEAQTLIPDIVLVPMVAFDRRRNRLGYGGGYYDRTLRALRAMKPVKAFGIAFAAQEVDELPAEPWDQPLDLIITEHGVI